MNELAVVMMIVQFIFIIIVGAYFWFALKQQQGSKVSLEKESRKQREKLIKLRKISLSLPLSEENETNRVIRNNRSKRRC